MKTKPMNTATKPGVLLRELPIGATFKHGAAIYTKTENVGDTGDNWAYCRHESEGKLYRVQWDCRVIPADDAKPGALAVMDSAGIALRREWTTKAEELAEARATVEKLAEALAPFAALLQADSVRSHAGILPNSQPIFAVNKAVITLGDLRRANAQLAAFWGAA